MVADVAVGTVWDVAVHDAEFGTAFATNLVGFGLGELGGYAAAGGLRRTGIGEAIGNSRAVKAISNSRVGRAVRAGVDALDNFERAAWARHQYAGRRAFGDPNVLRAVNHPGGHQEPPFAQLAGDPGEPGPGMFERVSEGMSADARLWQVEATGVDQGIGYVVRTQDGEVVKFDGYWDNILRDAKGDHGNLVVGEGRFADWKDTTEFVERARKQIAVADGHRIRWHVIDERHYRAFRDALKPVTGIELVVGGIPFSQK
jgi:hypothetical protein